LLSVAGEDAAVKGVGAGMGQDMPPDGAMVRVGKSIITFHAIYLVGGHPTVMELL